VKIKTPEELAEEYIEDHDECEFARDVFLAGYKAAQEESYLRISSIKPPREIIRFTPTETGFDVIIPEDVTLTEAAQKLIETVRGLLGKEAL